MAEELDIFQDTTAEETFRDTTAMEAEEAQEAAEELQYGEAIDWEATYEDAAKYLGVSEAEWQAFVEEVNAIKAEMNAYEGNVASVMQDRSTPNALRDRRVAVLLNQNPGMTPEEAIAQVESSPEYQQMIASFEQYEALNSRLNDLYESIGLDTQGSITGSDKSIEGGEVRFDLNTGGITFVELGKTGKYAKLGIGIAAGFIFGGPLGQALAQGLGVSAGAGIGAISGVTGSAISQGIAGGKIDTGQLLTAGILGGIGGLADDLAEGIQQTGAIPNAIDNAIWDLSGTLGLSYDETLRILEGMTTGAITGADIESIVAGAVGGYSEAKIAGLMRDYFGDSIDIDNFFREGDTTIPMEALTPVIGTAIQGLLEGGVSDADILTTLYDFFSEGGSLDFLWPALGELDIDVDGDFCATLPLLCINIPDICEKDEAGEKPWYCDIDAPDICPPGYFKNEETGECEPIIKNIKCPEGWDIDEDGICIEPPSLCGEGYQWDPQLGKCLPFGSTGPIKCPEGWDVDADGICIEPPELCGDGYSWDPQLGKCLPEEIGKGPDIGCPVQEVENGVQTFVKNELGECIPDIIECIPGFELQNQTCVQVCPIGQTRNPETGECEKTKGPEKPEGPDVDLTAPDIDLPKISIGARPSQGGFGQSQVRGLSYAPPQVPGMLAPPAQKDYTAELSNELDALIQRNLGGMFKGMV